MTYTARLRTAYAYFKVSTGNVLSALSKLTDKWGVVVDAVKIKNIGTDESMIRAMGHHAEAKRLTKAKIIDAKGNWRLHVFVLKQEISLGTYDFQWAFPHEELQNGPYQKAFGAVIDQ